MSRASGTAWRTCANAFSRPSTFFSGVSVPANSGRGSVGRDGARAKNSNPVGLAMLTGVPFISRPSSCVLYFEIEMSTLARRSTRRTTASASLTRRLSRTFIRQLA